MRFLDTSHIRTQFDVRVRTHDGYDLSLNLFLPPQKGCYPVLLHRTAAGSNRPSRSGNAPTESGTGRGARYNAPAERWKTFAAQGFIVAACDVRGRGNSGGAFTPFENEGADGAATLAWLRRLPEFNGKVGVLGSGYSAFCAWATAVSDGNVDAIASISPFGSVGNGLVHRGGMVRLDWLFWMHLIGGRTLQPANVPPWWQIYQSLPIAAMAEALGREDIWWDSWLDHPSPNDPFWTSLALTEAVRSLSIAGLHISGWWDGAMGAADDLYEAAREGGGQQRRIIGPWDSATVRRPGSVVGGVDFGPRAAIDMDEALVDFFDRHLVSPKSGGDNATSIFVTGRNEWCEVDAGFHQASETIAFHARSDAGANTRCGDGELHMSQGDDNGVDLIRHNPAAPVEFQPSFQSFAAGANALGFQLDQVHVTARDEALVYTSPPLTGQITALGHPTVRLAVRCSSLDADLVVLLSDTFPLGSRDLTLSHAAIRLATCPDFHPGSWHELELVLDPIAHDFLPGHHIRLTVTPSLFPLYARNPQTSDYLRSAHIEVADIELRYGPEAPAILTLPVADIASHARSAR